MLGPLTLNRDCAESAINTAQSMVQKGEGKIQNVRAVEVTPCDKLITLWEKK